MIAPLATTDEGPTPCGCRTCREIVAAQVEALLSKLSPIARADVMRELARRFDVSIAEVTPCATPATKVAP